MHAGDTQFPHEKQMQTFKLIISVPSLELVHQKLAHSKDSREVSRWQPYQGNIILQLLPTDAVIARGRDGWVNPQ